MQRPTLQSHTYINNYAIQLVLIILLYACYHALAQHIFFEGFLFSFQKINHILFGAGNAPAIFTTVPYHSNSIFLSSLQNPYFLAALALFYIPLLLKRKELAEKRLDFDKISRIVIFIVAAALAWELSTYDYNYYLDHAFYFDRILLIVLALLLLRYPLLSPLFLALAFVYRSQFNYPVDGFPLFDKRVFYDVLVMFMAHTYARLFIPSFKVPFLYFILCMVAANYFMTGLKKLLMQPHIYGWVACNDPGDLFTNVHYRGWLASTSDITIHKIAAFLSRYKVILQGIVLLIELSGILLLRRRKTAITLLLFFTLMHTGIFMLGSMLFWKWMVLDLFLVLVLVFDRNSMSSEIFTKKGFYASIVLILCSSVWLQPMMIGWYDTPVNQFFTYEVTTREGKVYELDKNEMNPYHQWFEYDNFFFLVNHPCLRITGFGYTNKYDLVKAIRQSGPASFKALEARLGQNKYNEKKKEQYDAFIKTYFANRNRKLQEYFWPSFFSAPNHLYSYSATGGYKNAAPIQRFKVIFNQVYTRDGKKTIIDQSTVDDILIPID